MKKIGLCAAIILASAATGAHAADDKVLLPISTVMEMPEAKEKLDGSVQFFFGNQKHPTALKTITSGKTSKKTNAFGKSEEEACNWAFLSAMIALSNKAKSVGADAVVNIASNYKNVEMSSPTEYECHTGTFIGGVALKADFIKLSAN